MTAEKPAFALGWRVYGVGVIALAVIGLVWGDFLSGQPVPKGFPDRTAFAYAAAAFMLVAGLATEWRRTAAWGALALTLYYTVAVVILMDGRVLLAHYTEYLAYENIAEQLAIAAGALIVYASFANIDAVLAARLTWLGQIAFGLCALVFGGAHFAYLNLTAPLVPKWLPPSQDFWAYATGVGQIAAGVAMLVRVQGRLAAILLAVMYASFLVLIWVPMLLAGPPDVGTWTESATTLVLLGVAWAVADSFGWPKRA